MAKDKNSDLLSDIPLATWQGRAQKFGPKELVALG